MTGNIQTYYFKLESDDFFRPTGDAVVAFYSHEDAQESMKKNRQYLGSRYVELFLRSNPDGMPNNR